MSESFLREGSFPYCKGCGHGLVARRLNDALGRLELDAKDVVITSDIGCVGLVDPLFPRIHTVHTIHGRSTAVATGTVLADTILGDGRLRNIVMLGDGGASIGLLHLAQAALMNVDVTVLLHNNMLYGMTGGQHSALTPEGFVTTTTPRGNWLPAVDMEPFLLSCQGGFFARKLATDADLADVIADAIRHPGFAVVEILELCTGYGVPLNHMDGSSLRALAEREGRALGVRINRRERAPFHVAYRERLPGDGHAAARREPRGFDHHLSRAMGLIVAGSAGERVQIAAAILCHAALAAEVHCTQKNDYPVTVGSGFSLSEIALSPDPILYTGIDRPDAIVIVSADGLREVRGRGDLDRLAPDGLVIADESLAADLPREGTISLPLRRALKPNLAAMGGIAAWLALANVIDAEALDDAVTGLVRDDAAAFSGAVWAVRDLVAALGDRA